MSPFFMITSKKRGNNSSSLDIEDEGKEGKTSMDGGPFLIEDLIHSSL